MTAFLDSRKRIVVVEPHADDAFLSVGAHIEEWTRGCKGFSRVWIWTVFDGTRNRRADAANYARAVGANWCGSGLVEGEPLEFTRKERLENDSPANDWIIQSESQFIVPLGITHREHITVRKYVEENAAGPIFYYMDQPYAVTQKNGPLITELLQGMKVVSYRKPGVRKYRHIPLFKDQALFYHYNPVEKLLQTCELLLAK